MLQIISRHPEVFLGPLDEIIHDLEVVCREASTESEARRRRKGSR
jgi:hypothetical protein